MGLACDDITSRSLSPTCACITIPIIMCRKERLELRAELLVALQDLDGRLATSREELSRQGPCVHVHRQSILTE